MTHAVKPATKRLGQHFLHDIRVLERIVTATGGEQGVEMVEIGPGTGALTKPLLQQGFNVTAVEMDERCWPVLEGISADFDGRLHVVQGDALRLEWLPRLPLGGTVVGNLPYNVGTEIVAQLVALREGGLPRVGRMVFMLQKEVVQRICARPGTDDWGRLAVLCQLHADCRSLFDVGPGAFSPPPKVMSSVVEIVPLPRPRYDVDTAKLDKLVRQAFGQRRKMLRVSLRGMVTEDDMLACGIAPTARVEEIGLEQLCKLAGRIQD